MARLVVGRIQFLIRFAHTATFPCTALARRIQREKEGAVRAPYLDQRLL